MATLNGMKGTGSVTLVPESPGRPPHYGAIFLDLDDHHRVVGLVETGSPARFVGPIDGSGGSKTVTLNVVVTKVHAPMPLGIRVNFVSTGAPLSETGAPG